MKKLFIMICGLPASGKTETAVFIKGWFKENHPELSVKIISRNRLSDISFPEKAGQYRIGNFDQSMFNKVEDLYFTTLDLLLNDPDTDVIISEDNRNMNVFTRKKIIEKAVENGAVCGAVNMNRDLYFCSKHLNHSIPSIGKAFLFECSRRYQQPLFDEDFFVIHNVDSNRHMNDNAVSKFVSRMFKHARGGNQ